VPAVPIEALNELEQKAAGKHHPRVIVLSGPAGGGKDTVLQHLRIRRFPITVIATWTTRARRETEVDGVDYCFVTREQFENAVASGGFLEYAEYAQHYYGVPRRAVQEALDRGEDVVLKIEVKGAAWVKLQVPSALTIFVAPPDIAELEWRLRLRRTETEADQLRRLAIARSELACIPGYDYLVINHRDRIEETVDQVQRIIVAERSRIGVPPVRL
jgi:guanylate kinase